MSEAYFLNIQDNILKYKNHLELNNVVIDKTNKEFLVLILNILEYFATNDAKMLDEQCEYNIMTMRGEFESIINSNIVDEKAQATLLIFFLRVAIEMQTKYKHIENIYLRELYEKMLSKKYRYPSYINDQKIFALDSLPENVIRMIRLK